MAVLAVSGALLGFLISLIISATIILLATKLFGKKQGFRTAILAALSGAIVFALVSYFIGASWLASFIGGIVWLIALSSLYRMGLLKSMIVAVVIWFFAAIVSWVLPTISGPL